MDAIKSEKHEMLRNLVKACKVSRFNMHIDGKDRIETVLEVRSTVSISYDIGTENELLQLIIQAWNEYDKFVMGEKS